MTFEPKLYTYYVSQLDDKGQRIDIGPSFKYLTETETQACIGRLAVYLAKLRYKADKITDFQTCPCKPLVLHGHV
jgi:hypothetical protein